MTAAIRVENVGKRYRVSHDGQRGYRTLRDSIVDAVKAPFRRLASGGESPASEDFWALNDVSFEVQPGEVVGIIGRNGAGKSTLLKILSRITKPTKGKIELNGRVGSLLEVGTGFHPELTGRENVYLNGSILGMTRKEIERKFDEIVAFAEVEKFLDTPVKRYSSGMYVRLAFAVAAHLEPEILVVDEVLAVGDAAFQKKCFDKMGEIRRSGRTVLVVSHNIGVMSTICTRGINLEYGKKIGEGLIAHQVALYLSKLNSQNSDNAKNRTDREGDQKVRVIGVSFEDADGQEVGKISCGQGLVITLTCQSVTPDTTLDYVALSCWTSEGSKVFHVDNLMTNTGINVSSNVRQYRCSFPKLPLAPGSYCWNAAISGNGVLRDHLYSAAKLDVIEGDFYKTGHPTPIHGSSFMVEHSWQAKESDK